MAKSKAQSSQRSLKLLRDDGYKAWSVEKYVTFFSKGSSAFEQMGAGVQDVLDLLDTETDLDYAEAMGLLENLLLIKPDRTGGVRRDMGGFADIIAIHPQATGCLAIQTTTKKKISGHLREYRRDKDVRANILLRLQTGNQLFFHGWHKIEILNKTKVGTHSRWRCEIQRVTADDMELNELDEKAIAKDAVHGWHKMEIPNKTKAGTHSWWRCEIQRVTADGMELNELDEKAITKDAAQER